MNQENIGKFIASLRKEKHLTQEQLAERLEVNNRSVSRWENGACMPDVSLFPLLANELDVSVAELVEGKRMCLTNYFVKEDAYMENYKILLEVNQRKTSGEEFTDKEKQEIVKVFLNGIACKEDVKKYKIRMRVNPSTDNTYPKFYIPPYNNNKKLRMSHGKMPKTHILYANHFELEVLKQLFMFAPEHPEVQKMIGSTLERLEKTCFGNYCSKGECVEAGACVLRFLEIVRPEEKEWIEKLRRHL